MFVHAHPDDEASQTAATMARYAAEGAQVTLVTCTLGEEGEIVAEDLAHLREDDALGRHRVTELTEAMAALGVEDFVRLGGDGTYRDSGMAYDERGGVVPAPVVHEDSFWRADLLQAADHLVALIRDRRPQVVITYDQFGGYGHPDHVQAHRVTTYAVALAQTASYRRDLGPAWTVSRLLWSAMAVSAMRRALQRLRESGDTESFSDWDVEGDEIPPTLVADDDIDVRIPGDDWAGHKAAALRAHRSQVDLEHPFWRLITSGEGWSDEYYRLAQGVPFPGEGMADDVFAGLL
ncbi:N-acetyl-1-D-myo-inositol-2-amino-2-deoxy-alpha-D-glucopyranoside deacetylase [Auraticoccus sp. F435]|uniref:N-acetyl-1-D-myo-inositol-2-amino-2-deoxy-alpha-D-glucopyranoside deacetylase n=2 Tax=Auraticoccus cholistanensis TaxID=2656650 RepID=A0A6A9UU68_9ACTN|nr:N-acetyl-1-D-myo-inositol-2-amino-2-deoxy-alpha-D-glucopyranoside deacetylase [Auraticoccus cholistanensis]MVA76218.1 N-acetyl-1-D-myo-inositol-2-amino-2-deoxy-alpha-D-glucopyranoside deacetylase [Auraticoccus cholistanensis]